MSRIQLRKGLRHWLNCATDGYPSGDAGADAFTADVIGVSDSQLQGLWLAHESATYRTIGTGVSAWLEQSGAVASTDATQATGSQQPAIDSLGPLGRGRLDFTRASSQQLHTAANFSTASDERWAWMVVVQVKDPSDGLLQQFAVLGDPPAAGFQMINKTQVDNFSAGVNYNDGAAGTWSEVILSAADSSAHRMEVASTNPHERRIDNTQILTSARTEGVSTRADTGGGQVSFGAWLNGNNPLNGYLMFALLAKLSGDGLPDWWNLVRTYTRRYYGV